MESSHGTPGTPSPKTSPVSERSTDGSLPQGTSPDESPNTPSRKNKRKSSEPRRRTDFAVKRFCPAPPAESTSVVDLEGDHDTSREFPPDTPETVTSGSTPDPEERLQSGARGATPLPPEIGWYSIPIQGSKVAMPAARKPAKRATESHRTNRTNSAIGEQLTKKALSRVLTSPATPVNGSPAGPTSTGMSLQGIASAGHTSVISRERGHTPLNLTGGHPGHIGGHAPVISGAGHAPVIPGAAHTTPVMMLPSVTPPVPCSPSPSSSASTFQNPEDEDGDSPPYLDPITGRPTRRPRKNYKNMTRERRVEANARERSRVHTISAAFESLRRAVPSYSYNQKLSKLAILRIACSYIMALSKLADVDLCGKKNSNLTFTDCVDMCTATIQTEGRARRRH